MRTMVVCYGRPSQGEAHFICRFDYGLDTFSYITCVIELQSVMFTPIQSSASSFCYKNKASCFRTLPRPRTLSHHTL